MESRSRRSSLLKTADNASTDSPKNVGTRRRSSAVGVSNVKPSVYSGALDEIYECEVVTPKKTLNIRKLNQNQILQQLGDSDDEFDNASGSEKNVGKDNYKVSKLDIDSNTIKMKIINDKCSTEVLIGAKERTKVNNHLSNTPKKTRRTLGKINYNEDVMMDNHEKECKEKIKAAATPKRGSKNSKPEVPKNAAEISPRKRSNQNSPQGSELYGDENEMSQANQITSPPKRSKSETTIENTPKKNIDTVDVMKTPRSAAKRKIFPEENTNSRVTRRSTLRGTPQKIHDSKVNYVVDVSSSDENITTKEAKVVLNDINKSLKKKTDRQCSNTVGISKSEESDIENKNSNINTPSRSVRSKSKLLQTPVYSPTKDMQKMNIGTPKTSGRLKFKYTNTSSKSTPSESDDKTTRRQSQRVTKQRYEIQKCSESDENGDSSDDYKAENDSEDESEDESSEDSPSSGEDSADEFQAPRRTRRQPPKTPKKTPAQKGNKRLSKVSMNTPTKAISRMSIGTPSLDKRLSSIMKPSTPLQEARAKLHVSVLPKSLPCREEQFNDIYSFLHARLSDGSGGCIYISGVPGTGKTATVSEVIRILKKSMIRGELAEFDYIDINGMKLSEPRQAYVHIWRQMSGETKTWEESHKLLQNKFNNSNSKKRMTLLLVDELDLLCTKRQDVVYNLLDWPSKTNAKLVVVTIANTMDLPERILMGKVTSRLGLTRLTFPPYNFKQLEEIVASRLKGFNAFGGDTIQLVARKVASVSGDARRALDICRRAAEIAEHSKRDLVSMLDVKEALEEMIASPKIQAIMHCSEFEKYFLKAVCAEVHRTGVEEVVFKNVYMQMETLCTLDGFKAPNISIALEICSRLGSYRLLLCDHSRMDIHQRLLLNVSTDDVHFATKNITEDE